ncbi:MAG: hypothetical protein KU37_04500 [Sulfuricurvum sp. PC08-66]|nr:MAG: hypothetical protein KU37_04500 [Sulfuricurvum sp. PC08-66]
MIYSNALLLSVALIAIGIIGVVGRRNIFVVYMSLEIILNGINLGFVTGARIFGHADGQVVALLVMAIAAAEAALFLAMVVLLFGHRRSLDSARFNLLGDTKAVLDE